MGIGMSELRSTVTSEKVLVDPYVLECFTIDALNDVLVHQDQGCCLHCCRSCAILNDLLANGQLDAAVGAWRGRTHTWWDRTINGVDRARLAAAWDPKYCDKPWELDDTEEVDE